MDENKKTSAHIDSKKDNKSTTKQVPQKIAAETKKEKKAFIYIGPNIQGGRLFHGYLCKDKIPKYLDDLIKQIPEVKKMFVEVQNLPDAKIELARKGSKYDNLTQIIRKKIREGALKDGI